MVGNYQADERSGTHTNVKDLEKDAKHATMRDEERVRSRAQAMGPLKQYSKTHDNRYCRCQNSAEESDNGVMCLLHEFRTRVECAT